MTIITSSWPSSGSFPTTRRLPRTPSTLLLPISITSKVEPSTLPQRITNKWESLCSSSPVKWTKFILRRSRRWLPDASAWSRRRKSFRWRERSSLHLITIQHLKTRPIPWSARSSARLKEIAWRTVRNYWGLSYRIRKCSNPMMTS